MNNIAIGLGLFFSFSIPLTAEQHVGLRVGLLDFLELRAQAETERLELQVGVLAAWYLVEIHIGIATLFCIRISH